jgi:hypothetical protein
LTFFKSQSVAHDLFKRHTQLQALLDKDILEKTKPQAVDAKKPKKKIKAASKKNEKENQNPDDNDESLMPPPTLAGPSNTEKTTISSTFKKTTYAYRLSYSCTLKLFKLIYW